MKKILLAVVVIIIGAIAALGLGFNGLVEKEGVVNNAMAKVENSIEKKINFIPKLITIAGDNNEMSMELRTLKTEGKKILKKNRTLKTGVPELTKFYGELNNSVTKFYSSLGDLDNDDLNKLKSKISLNDKNVDRSVKSFNNSVKEFNESLDTFIVKILSNFIEIKPKKTLNL